MITELAEKIWEHKEFHKDYHSLVLAALRKELHLLNKEKDGVSTVVLTKLLRSATALAGASKIMLREAAYRIAIAAWILNLKEYDGLFDIVNFIFCRMGNFPTSELLVKQQRSFQENNKLNRLPLNLWFEVNSRRDENSVNIDSAKKLVFTDFQILLWENLGHGKSLSVSAPTSAGKSYALQHFLICESLKKDKFLAVYIVPTRALINQVSDSLAELISHYSRDNVFISTIPVNPLELKSNRIFYVLTQERLQLLNETADLIDFNLVIVDESQIISDDSRGIVLQTVIEKILERIPNIQIMFASPLTDNPQVFTSLFKLDTAEVMDEEECPVAQNLVFLDVNPIRPREVKVSTLLDGKDVSLGVRRSDSPLYDVGDLLPRLAWFFGRSDKNLIYFGGQAGCEKIANKLADLYAEENNTTNDSDELLNEFSQFIKVHIHPKYILASTIKHGIAFHYGNMPAVIRKTIENFFAEGRLKSLVCTSTLLHGINLPAKNLFMFNPTKGREWASGKDIHLTSEEFWNLAGRAGRLGKDFEGNIFLINKEHWGSDPFDGRKRQTVEPSFSVNLTTKGHKLVEFIRDQNHSSGRADLQGLENTFVKLFNDYRRGRIDTTLDRVSNVPDDVKDNIINVLENVIPQIDVPKEVLERNITISPYRQQAMLKYLLEKTRVNGPEDILPVHPLAEWNVVYQSYLRMFKRIHSNFQMLKRDDKSHTYFAPLALRWMRGEPLARLINDAYKYKEKTSRRRSPPSVATVIREVMRNIEQELRFKYVKFTSCYLDLLKEALKRLNHSDYIESIPNIPLFLEFGASSKTMISLIGLGLSRTTSYILADKIINKDMNPSEVKEWLKKQDLEELGISKICIREIEKFL